VVVLEGHPAVGGAEIPVTTATLPSNLKSAIYVPRTRPLRSPLSRQSLSRSSNA
jgi:hypothetical protein